MSSTIDRAAGRAAAPARRLQTQFAAVRLGFTWFGVKKTLSREQKQQAAETFDAEGGILTAAKKLLDTRDPSFAKVSAVRNRAINYWRGASLPYPEPGHRLIRHDRIEQFDRQMTDLKQELIEAVAELDEHYAELKQSARQRLGRLYDPADYPRTLRDLFEIQWEFPSLAPPEYLLQLKPELYEQEKARIAARFDEAVKLAEQAFTAEFSRLITHLSERVSGRDDGKPKIFRDSAVDNLREFFARFKDLSINSNHQLDDLVEQAQKLLKGIAPQDLRESDPLRTRIASELSKMQSSLDDLLIERPRRRILRRQPEAAA